MVLGVSTRGYARSLEPLPEAVAVRGISKSAVSARFVYGTERKLAALMSRDLRELRVVALLIDGVHFGPHLVLAAVGVDEHGDKHVLGLREGATENTTAVRALLADLVPPHLWDGAADPAIPSLNLAPPGYNIGLPERCAALSNSFAFGGSNASVILGRGW
jgi:transposase-like protein